MRVWFLGTGGAISGARRGNTSLAVSADVTALVDCSGNPAQALQRCGADWRSVEHVLLTHEHADHLCGLPSLVHALYVDARPHGRGPLQLWGPEGALEAARGLLAAVGLDGREDLFEIGYHPVAGGRQRIELSGLEVTAFAVDHGQVPTVGYRIGTRRDPRAGQTSSAATQPSAAVVEHSRGCRLLVHECSCFERPHMPGHTTLDQLGAIVERTDVERVLLVHLPPASERDEAAVRQRLQAEFGERVALAEDGLGLALA